MKLNLQEKIKQDPAQFLQINGRGCKLHLDHNLSGEPPNMSKMTPWQGNSEILIDRFDVRAHLDYIPDIKNDADSFPEEAKDMRPLNYERYRILIQNSFLKLKEEKFLKQIALEEKFGGKTYQQQKAEEDKKKSEKSKAAISFNYGTAVENPTPNKQNEIAKNNVESEEEDDEEFDLDTQINFSALSRDQIQELNSLGKSYFLGREDFINFLQHEVEEQESARNARQEEDEKSAFSGRKSRKERRILKERKLAGRILTEAPSYATFEDDKNTSSKNLVESNSSDSSRSPSPSGKVVFITTFGEENNGSSNKKKSSSSAKKKRRPRSSSSSSSDDNRLVECEGLKAMTR